MQFRQYKPVWLRFAGLDFEKDVVCDDLPHCLIQRLPQSTQNALERLPLSLQLRPKTKDTERPNLAGNDQGVSGIFASCQLFSSQSILIRG